MSDYGSVWPSQEGGNSSAENLSPAMSVARDEAVQGESDEAFARRLQVQYLFILSVHVETSG